MENENEEITKVKLEDQEEFDKFLKTEKWKNTFLKLAIFSPIFLCYLVNFVRQFEINDNIQNQNDNQLNSWGLMFFLTSTFCLVTIISEIFEWYNLNKKPKEDTKIDSEIRKSFIKFLLPVAIITVLYMFFVDILHLDLDFLKDKYKFLNIFSSVVSLLFIFSCIIKNMLYKTEVTDKMIKRFYDIKHKKQEKLEKKIQRKQIKKNKKNLKNKEQIKYEIHNEYHNCKIYYQKEE